MYAVQRVSMNAAVQCWAIWGHMIQTQRLGLSLLLTSCKMPDSVFPGTADLSKLTWVDSIARETLRLHATAPLGSMRYISLLPCPALPCPELPCLEVPCPVMHFHLFLSCIGRIWHQAASVCASTLCKRYLSMVATPGGMFYAAFVPHSKLQSHIQNAMHPCC